MRLGNILSCETATYLFWWLLDERHAHGMDLVLPVDEVDALAIVSWPVGMETKIAVTDALVKVAVREGWRITKTDGRGPYRC
jgi:hypothetical protein